MLTCGAYEAAAFGITVTINDTEIFAPIQTAFGASFTNWISSQLLKFKTRLNKYAQDWHGPKTASKTNEIFISATYD